MLLLLLPRIIGERSGVSVLLGHSKVMSLMVVGIVAGEQTEFRCNYL
jgi:hypothetical protein